MSMSRRTLSLTANAQAASNSKFRNIFMETWSPSTYVRNINANMTVDPLVQVSPLFYAVPWKMTGNGVLYVGLLNKADRISDKPFLLHAHDSQLTSYQFSPFHERMLATGAKDGLVKIWNIPPDGLTEDLFEANSIITHEKRINNLAFHPCVDNIISTASGDGVVRVFDLNHSDQPTIVTTPIDSDILALEWEGCYGDTLMTVSKDLMYRLYDPRIAPEPITSFVVSETVKGLKAKFIDGTDYFAVSGFSKKGDRVVNMFDQRKQGIVGKALVDNQPSPLSMFYDDNNNLLYLTSRGNQFMTYDIQGSNLVNINKSNVNE
ncbi:actin-binding protein, putative, partial [Entamoeba invadens IP1]